MSKEYIQQEIGQILSSKKSDEIERLALVTAWICGHYKGTNLKILNVSGRSSIAEYFVLASVSNVTQGQAIADEVLYQLKQIGVKRLSSEGLDGADWILVDTGDVILHIFQESARELFDLDSLWGDCPNVKIPDSFYHSEPELATAVAHEEKGYF